jgi:dipeptidyl aminopeptidase/acylaminoacyl peptidase
MQLRALVFLFATLPLAAQTARRPMTFEDLQAIKRIADPQVSPSGRWVMFSVTDVDLAANRKTTHLWTVSIDGKVKERAITSGKAGESEGRFSPDRRQVLFVSANGGSSQIWLAPWDETKGSIGEAKQLTSLSTEADSAIWSPDSKSIAFVSDVYPACDQDVFDAVCNQAKDDEAAKNPVKAQVFESLLYRHWDHYQGAKRSHILLVSASDGSQVRDLTPAREIGDHVAPTFSLGGPVGYAFSPDAKEFAYVVNLDKDPSSSTNNDIYTIQLGDARAKPLKITTSPGSDDAPAYSPDGKYIAFRSQARNGFESDRFRLMLYDRGARTARELLPKFDRWVDEFVWAPNSQSILFASGDTGEESIFVLYLRKSRETQLSFDSGEYSGLNFTPDGQTLISSRMMIMKPSEITALDLQHVNFSVLNVDTAEDIQSRSDKKNPSVVESSKSSRVVSRQEREGVHDEGAKAITALNALVLNVLDMQDMEEFWFSSGKSRVEGFIIRPPNFDPSKKYPLKFLMHGGPQTAWGNAWSYRWNPELFAANGYVVVMINRRGSTGYGQKFIDEVSGDWGGKAYQDLMLGLDYAEKAYPFIDKTRECALGASYGGFMANWVLTHTHRFACIVSHDGMYNPQSAYGSTEELWFNEWEFRAPGSREPGQPWKQANLPVAQDPFRRWSPMRHIQSAKTPTLIIHSQKDYRLDVSEGFQMFTALQRLGVPSKMLYFPDEGHWVLKPQNSKLWYETVNDWCDRWTHTNKYGPARTATSASREE